MDKMTRREFVKTSALSFSALSYSRIYGANERIYFAQIGCGDRGEYVARGFVDDGAEFVHLCDPYKTYLDKHTNLLGGLQGRKPKADKHFQKILENKDVDAVLIATPDHWHAIPMIEACKAGKSVYLEKPQSHNVWEGRQMIKAAKKYNTIVQIGAQNRSAPYNFAAREYIQSGKLGDIRFVKVYHMKSGAAFQNNRNPYSVANPEPRPKDLDWDLWLGPANERAFHQNIFNDYGWTAFWDFSVGDLNDGIHQTDLAMMLMGEPNPPKTISSIGGRLHYKGDDAEPPDVMATTFNFENFIMTLEMTGYPRYMQKTTTTIRRNDEFPYWTQNATRIEIYGSEEMMIVGRMGGGWISMTSGGKVVQKMYGRVPDGPHRKDFLECIKTGKQPNGDIEKMHNSTNLVHLANISFRVGNKTLEWDGTNEKVKNNENANLFLKRNYRKGYEVPDVV